MVKSLWLFALLFGAQAFADLCPGTGNDPALKLATKAGPSLILCGFEDHEVFTPKGKRAFSEFEVYSVTATNPKPQKVFVAELSETYWVKPVAGHGLELEELWFFSEKPEAALWRDISCETENCKLAASKCVFKIKPGQFPKALALFEEKRREKKLDDGESADAGDGEELLDQIWAQAITGDKAAAKFYETKPSGLDSALSEAFEANRKKLIEIRELKCI